MIERFRLIGIVGCAVVMTACACGPALWAERLEQQVKCGMTPQEVERLAGRPVEPLGESWATHFIGDEVEATRVWLVFKDDKLWSIQLAWMYRLKKMASAQRVNLCSAPPAKSTR